VRHRGRGAARASNRHGSRLLFREIYTDALLQFYEHSGKNPGLIEIISWVVRSAITVFLTRGRSPACGNFFVTAYFNSVLIEFYVFVTKL